MSKNELPLLEKSDLEKAVLSMQPPEDEQSVRTTFKLSEGVMDVLASMTQNGVLMKDFFGGVCSDLASKTDQEDCFLHRSLRRAKEGAVETSSSAVRKTLVISQASLSKFNELSRKHRI